MFNRDLMTFARKAVVVQDRLEKDAFTDPAAMAAGGDPMAAGGDPMAGGMPADPMAGAMPPMPPMGMDPAAGGAPPAPGDAAGGGAPIADPAAAGADPGVSRAEFDMLTQKIDQLVAGGGAGGAGGEGGAGGAPKMKVDVNTEIYQLKKMMVMLFQNQGIEVPASMLLGDPAQDPSVPPEEASQDPASAAASQGSAIGGIDPIQGASPAMAAAGGGGAGGGAAGGGAPPKMGSHDFERGVEVRRSLIQQTNKAAALAAQLRAVSRNNAA